jgi:hypothetical protein
VQAQAAAMEAALLQVQAAVLPAHPVRAAQRQDQWAPDRSMAPVARRVRTPATHKAKGLPAITWAQPIHRHRPLQVRHPTPATCQSNLAVPAMPGPASSRLYEHTLPRRNGGSFADAYAFPKQPGQRPAERENASRFRADLAQLIPGLYRPQMQLASLSRRGQNAGAAAIAPVVSNSGAGRRQGLVWAFRLYLGS